MGLKLTLREQDTATAVRRRKCVTRQKTVSEKDCSRRGEKKAINLTVKGHENLMIWVHNTVSKASDGQRPKQRTFGRLDGSDHGKRQQ